MRARALQPAILAILACCCAGIVLTTPSASPERVIAALLLVLVLPGVALTGLLPTAHLRGNAERLILIAALSVAAVILVSAGLYVVGISLGLDSWVISLAAVTVVASLLSIWIPGAALLPRSLSLRPARGPGVAVVAAIASVGVILAGAAVVTARSISSRQARDHFTQLWAKPEGARGAVIGIYNHEGAVQRYQLRVYSDAGLVRTETFALGSRRTWTTNQQAPLSTSRLRVTISLASAPSAVYRWVQLRFRPSAHRRTHAHRAQKS